MSAQKGPTLPKNLREYTAVLKRVEARVYMQVAENLRRKHRERTLEELAQEYESYARDREGAAVFAETRTGADMTYNVRQMLNEVLDFKRFADATLACDSGLCTMALHTEGARGWVKSRTKTEDWQWRDARTLVLDDQKLARELATLMSRAGLIVAGL